MSDCRDCRWIRDSALVYKYLVDTYVAGRDNSLLQGIYDWVSSQTKLQQVPNPSGTVDAGGLGEPKFMINETAFTGELVICGFDASSSSDFDSRLMGTPSA